MKDPRFWVVAATHREQQLKWILESFKRQTHQNKRLIIVENGPAVGGCARQGIVPDKVVTSEEHAADARNAGVYAVIDEGGGWVCMMDDDDYYGPNYLAEYAIWVQKGIAEVYGKQRHFVGYTKNGLYLYNERNALKYSPVLHGPTFCFRAEEAVYYRRTPAGEEMDWAAQMQSLGFRMFATSIHHFMYLRGGNPEDHTWQVEDAWVHETAKCNDYHYWFGDIDLRVVDGVVPWQPAVKETSGERYNRPILLEAPIPIKIMPPKADLSTLDAEAD